MDAIALRYFIRKNRLKIFLYAYRQWRLALFLERRNVLEKKIHKYRAFGLYVLSDIPFKELVATEESEPSTPSEVISIKQRDLSSIWDSYGKERQFKVLTDQSVLFKVNETATFYIEGGRVIYFDPHPSGSIDKVRLFILGSCMGVLLMQRRILPLHGSAIMRDGKAYLIVGDSGAGKSTLASTLILKGWSLLSDDVIPIQLINGIAYVVPSYPQQKLWDESIKKLGLSVTSYHPLFERENKYAIPVQNVFTHHSVPLAGIFVLHQVNERPKEIQSLNGLQKIEVLDTHTYRPFMIERLDLLAWHFDLSVKIASQIPMYAIERSNSFSAYELADTIHNLFEEEHNDSKEAIVNQ